MPGNELEEGNGSVPQISVEREISMDSIAGYIEDALHIVEIQMFIQRIIHDLDQHLNSIAEADRDRKGSSLFKKSEDHILGCDGLKQNQSSLYEAFRETRKVSCSQIIKIYQRNRLVLCDCFRRHLAPTHAPTVELWGGAETVRGGWEIEMESLLGF